MADSTDARSDAARADITAMLEDVRAGRINADALLPCIYGELRRIAAARMAFERPGQTLQPTALVHEAWLRLAGAGHSNWESRRHFFAAAAEAMRRILVEQARRRRAQKHGGQFARISLPDVSAETPDASAVDLIALDDALRSFSVEDAEKARLVQLRYFAGLSESEAAEALGISRATAARWWAFARAWLLDRMK